jgi:hypothetical protein
MDLEVLENRPDFCIARNGTLRTGRKDSNGYSYWKICGCGRAAIAIRKDDNKYCEVCYHYMGSSFSTSIFPYSKFDCKVCDGFSYLQLRPGKFYPCSECLGSGRSDIKGTRDPNECVRDSTNGQSRIKRDD